MSAAVLEAPPGLFAGEEGAPAAGGRGVTLEQRLEAAWSSAQREGSADCPVCQAVMLADGAGAQCGRCGSVLT